MSSNTGLFQFDPYHTDQAVPAQAEMVVDPLGQVVAVITAYLPEGVGSSLYDWQETAYLRPDFAREKLELVWTFDGEFSLEREWKLDVHDDEVRDYLLLLGGDEPDSDSFATLARWAPDLKIEPPGEGFRDEWDDASFRNGVVTEDWVPPADDDA